jgi:hypothetical protein
MRQFGRSALCRACEKGEIEIVKVLLKDLSTNVDIVANVGVPSGYTQNKTKLID